MFKPFDDNNVVQDLQLRLFEKDTIIAELEMIQKFNEDKIKELQLKVTNLEAELKELKEEVWKSKMVAIKSTTTQKKYDDRIHGSICVICFFLLF